MFESGLFLSSKLLNTLQDGVAADSSSCSVVKSDQFGLLILEHI